MKKRLAHLLFPALLAGIAFALFSFGIADGHLQLDDWGYTAGCPFVASGLTPANVAQAFTNLGHGGIWMPLTYVTYMADFSLFGGGWTVHHAVNVALHALNAVLVYAFLLALLRRFRSDAKQLPFACFLAALVWTVHPMRAEAVVWIASRKEELWTTFALLSSLAWLRFLDCRTIANYLLAFAAFVLACLAKPTAVCIPLVLFALEFLVGTKPRKIASYLPMLFVATFVGLIAIHSQLHPTGTPAVDVFGTSFPWRLLNSAVALGMYFWHMVFPLGIHIDYRAMPNAMPLDAALGLTVFAIVLVAFAFLTLSPSHSSQPSQPPQLPQPSKSTTRRLLIASASIFFITLLPVLGIVGFTGDKAYADRYLYLPMVALMIPFATVLDAAMTRWGKRRILASVLLIPATLAVVAVPVIRSFRDDAAAYTRVLSLDPNHWRALRIIGNVRCTQPGRMDDGIAMLSKSLTLRPSQITANSLAYVLAIRGQAGDFDRVQKLGKAIAAQPALDREGMMLEALGIVAMRTKNDAEAVRLFLAAAHAPERSHSLAHALLNLGLSLANCGRTREATVVLKRVRATCDGKVRDRAVQALAAVQAGERERFAWSAE